METISSALDSSLLFPPYSLGKLIEWKLATASVTPSTRNGLYSLGKLIEWKLIYPDYFPSQGNFLIPIFSQQIYSLSQQAMRADRHHPPPVQNHRFLENERALPPGGKGIGHYPLVSTIA